MFQKDIETMPRQKIEELQLERLKWLVDYCMTNIPFYNKRLTEAGVTAEKIKSLKDIEYIPYTTKADIRDTYPFGLFGQPMKKIVRIHASSGTTGKPTVVGYTKNDLENWSDCMARLCCAAGATDEDIVQIAFGYGLFTGKVRSYSCSDIKRQHRKADYAYAGLPDNCTCFYTVLCTVHW